MSLAGLPASPAVDLVANQGIYNAAHGVFSSEHIIASVSEFGFSAFKGAVRNIWKDKLFVTFLGLSVAGFGYIGVREYLRLREFREKVRLAKKARDAAVLKALGGKQPNPEATIAALEDSVVKAVPKRQRAKTVSLFSQLKRLLSVAIPSPTSYTAQLLIVQFFLLVLRTFLTINCVKVAITAITKAISKASFKNWVDWLAQFSLWMSGGIIVNSGLHFFQSLIALSIRRELTRHAHDRYLKHMNFYRVVTMSKSGVAMDSKVGAPTLSASPSPAAPACQQGQTTTPFTAGIAAAPANTTTPTVAAAPAACATSPIRIDNIEQRIARDIQVFSDNVSFLYGHSFKPVLEFILSLAEASRDLGFKRPLMLFGVSAVINMFCKMLTPHLGRMVAKEAELEGDFQQAHTRIVGHCEEIAFMDGGDTERSIVNNKLDEVITTKTWHTLQKIRKSVADNIIKFAGMLIGGVFVHIPFLLATNLPADKRISQFRATEEIMMRCGTSFSELILLNRELQELSGYAGRITDLFDALDVVEKEESKKEQEQRVALATVDSATPLAAEKTVGLTSSLSRKGSMHTLRGMVKDVSLQVDIQHGVFPAARHRNTGANAQDTISPASSLAMFASAKDERGLAAFADKPVIVFDDVTVVAPEDYPTYLAWRGAYEAALAESTDAAAALGGYEGRVLLDNLNLTIPQGKSVLVTGPNGAGKTSLFRTLAGLWPLAAGTIIKPHSDDGALMLLPQKPYMVSGTLRDQVTYPHIYKLRVKGRSNYDVKNVKFVTEDEMQRIDEAVMRVCVQAGVNNVVHNQAEGLDTLAAWDSKLSGGERQKVAIARVLYHKPLFAVLDEATSAMHPENELQAYSALVNSGITVFSIAHRPALRVFHDLQLELDGTGGWKLLDLANNRTEDDLVRIRENAEKLIASKAASAM